MNKLERLEKDGFAGIEPVLFYGKETCGSNFSDHSIWLPHPFTGEMVKYRTGEHRYQAMKGTNELEHEHVRAQIKPFQAKDAGRSITLRPGWGDKYGDLCWYVMFETVLAKTLQHSDVYQWLMSTGARPIYEDSPTDDIWGWRYRNDYRGKNLLGRAWMEVREVLE